MLSTILPFTLLRFKRVSEALVARFFGYAVCRRITNKSVFAHHKRNRGNRLLAVLGGLNHHERTQALGFDCVVRGIKAVARNVEVHINLSVCDERFHKKFIGRFSVGKNVRLSVYSYKFKEFLGRRSEFTFCKVEFVAFALLRFRAFGNFGLFGFHISFSVKNFFDKFFRVGEILVFFDKHLHGKFISVSNLETFGFAFGFVDIRFQNNRVTLDFKGDRNVFIGKTEIEIVGGFITERFRFEFVERFAGVERRRFRFFGSDNRVFCLFCLFGGNLGGEFGVDSCLFVGYFLRSLFVVLFKFFVDDFVDFLFAYSALDGNAAGEFFENFVSLFRLGESDERFSFGKSLLKSEFSLFGFFLGVNLCGVVAFRRFDFSYRLKSYFLGFSLFLGFLRFVTEFFDFEFLLAYQPMNW